MKQKNLLFTFDYELFLGSNSGSVQKCMIKPTEILLQSLNAYGIKGIFFVDSTYLVELEKKAQDYEKAKTDFNLIKNQLNDMILNGHYVYPHLHPHWMDATYNEASNSWSLENASNYRFESLNHLSTVCEAWLKKVTPIIACKPIGLVVGVFSLLKPLNPTLQNTE